MPKNILRLFKLDEISCVDRPANKHARATIMKRDNPMPDASTFEKINQLFAEAKAEGVTAAEMAKGFAERPELYAGYETAKREAATPGYHAVLKRKGEAEAELDGLAKAEAQRGGIGYAAAYVRILDTPRGRALYADCRGPRAAA